MTRITVAISLCSGGFSDGGRRYRGRLVPPTAIATLIPVPFITPSTAFINDPFTPITYFWAERWGLAMGRRANHGAGITLATATVRAIGKAS